MLSVLGLSTQHEAVYRAMLDQPELTVSGLAGRLGVDPAEVHGALDVLADLALVRIGPGGVGMRAVRPQAGLSMLLAKVEADIATRQRQIEETRSVIAAIVSDYDDQEREEGVRRLEGLDVVRERLAELAQEARTECLSFSTGGAQAPATIEAEKPLNTLALDRGVRIRNVYQDSFRNCPTTLAYARWMADRGGVSRTVPTLPLRLVIVDRETALVPIDPGDQAAGALELRSPGVIAGLVALFEQVWQSGTPFGEAPARDVNGLLPQEKELLRLLAEGHTDESAARKLAVSLRSVQRMMTGLTERLESASRFQAGIRAARRGWV
ncbi:LuxR family transcriptional regulator [Longispora sp. K20-0274]|uniref:LuxR family transcriptional regulator n=1 Tax=Longispora sp. K20-0274 TaxID=3088255 RepID=UPI00399B97C4